MAFPSKQDLDWIQDSQNRVFRSQVKGEVISRLSCYRQDIEEVSREAVDRSFAYLVNNSTSRIVGFDDCVQLSILLLLLGDDADAVLNGPVMSNSLVGISRRISLTIESYLQYVRYLEGGAG